MAVGGGGELVLGEDEGEEALPEAAGADADAPLARVLLALHPCPASPELRRYDIDW